MIDLRGSVLGRLTTGTLRVTDQTPNDRYAALVVGRKVTQERLGPRTVLYRGQGLRFRMLGGGYRMVARGSGISGLGSRARQSSRSTAIRASRATTPACTRSTASTAAPSR